MSDGMRFETRAIHAGQEPDPATGAAVVPIYQTSTFVQEAVARHKGYEYSRTDNPTRRAVETCLAALESAPHAITFASGMAAIATLALTLDPGDRVILPDDVYGGTHRLFSQVTEGFGIGLETVDMTDMEQVSAVTAEGAALVFAETPTNPLLKILDLRALAEITHAAGALLAVDNTFATPYTQRPLELGADVVVYSGTKYLGGHSDLVMGSLATSNEQLAGRLRWLQNSVGAVPGPFDCWLLLRGLKTLALRMKAHSLGALAIANWLEEQDSVEMVHYPGLPDWPGHRLASVQMAASGEPLYGGMVSFSSDSEERSLAICERTKLFFLAESLGGVESLIEHPARMTHASVAGTPLAVPASLVRLSVGIEHPNDLIADLEQAFA